MGRIMRVVVVVDLRARGCVQGETTPTKGGRQSKVARLHPQPYQSPPQHGTTRAHTRDDGGAAGGGRGLTPI